MDQSNIPHHIGMNLHPKVEDFLINQRWFILLTLRTWFPTLLSHITKTATSMEPKNVWLTWNHTVYVALSLQNAYSFTYKHQHPVAWSKIIWNQTMTPSHFILMCRIIHNKTPIDDNLMVRGCTLPSTWSLCGKASENAKHLFINCPFPLRFWSQI